MLDEYSMYALKLKNNIMIFCWTIKTSIHGTGSVEKLGFEELVAEFFGLKIVVVRKKNFTSFFSF